MNFVYHRVPEDMQGNILYPLNVLKSKYPHQYQEQVKKYKNRLEVMEQAIPKLDCLWNDVLHFTALHPSKLREALISVGFNPPARKFYKINTKVFKKEHTIVYLYRPDIEKGMEKDITNFAEFHEDDIEKYNILPKETIDYYQGKYESGEQPLLFVSVPHILYKGSIDISGCEIVEY